MKFTLEIELDDDDYRLNPEKLKDAREILPDLICNLNGTTDELIAHMGAIHIATWLVSLLEEKLIAYRQRLRIVKAE
jgi:hypothetical protein